MDIFTNFISNIKNNRKVLENYFFMTVFQILNSFFYLLIYPYLIRVLGPASYGVYLVGVNIASYFQTLITFGFDFPALKAVSLSKNDHDQISKTFSIVLYAKIVLFTLSLLIFGTVLLFVNEFIDNGLIYLVCFINVFSLVLYPQWYFQGLQRMRIVTVVQLFFKLLSLPLIFIFIKNESDIIIFAIITVVFNLASSIYLFCVIILQDKIKILVPSKCEVFNWLKISSPFFASNSVNTLKQQSTTTIIAIFFFYKKCSIL